MKRINTILMTALLASVPMMFACGSEAARPCLVGAEDYCDGNTAVTCACLTPGCLPGPGFESRLDCESDECVLVDGTAGCISNQSN